MPFAGVLNFQRIGRKNVNLRIQKLLWSSVYLTSLWKEGDAFSILKPKYGHFGCVFPLGLERDKFDNKTVTFEEHIKEEHNMWHYLFFIVLVKVKDSTEYTGPESYVAEMIKVSLGCSFSDVWLFQAAFVSDWFANQILPIV